MCVRGTTRLSIPSPGTNSIHFCADGALVGTRPGLQVKHWSARNGPAFVCLYSLLFIEHLLRATF